MCRLEMPWNEVDSQLAAALSELRQPDLRRTLCSGNYQVAKTADVWLRSVLCKCFKLMRSTCVCIALTRAMTGTMATRGALAGQCGMDFEAVAATYGAKITWRVS